MKDIDGARETFRVLYNTLQEGVRMMDEDLHGIKPGDPLNLKAEVAEAMSGIRDNMREAENLNNKHSFYVQ